MKWIKKVSTTPLENIAKVINSLANGSDTNAPSINAVNGAISSLTSLINTKQDKISMTANKAVITDGNGKLKTSGTSATQIGYLSTLTGNVQTQINNINTAISNLSTISRLYKENTVTAANAGDIYSTTFTFGASDGYNLPLDGGLYTVYSSTNGIRIDSVTRSTDLNSVSYYVLYHGTTNNASGKLTLNVFLSSSFDVTPNA